MNTKPKKEGDFELIAIEGLFPSPDSENMAKGSLPPLFTLQDSLPLLYKPSHFLSPSSPPNPSFVSHPHPLPLVYSSESP